jgi:tRNA(Ile)-lysidine synthase
MDQARGPVFVGFSGGLDSTVLLHAAARVRLMAAGGELVAVHVNHGLQPDADAWQAHCERFAAGLGVGFAAHGVHVERRGSLEAAARAARYGVFTALLATPDARLLLAHHRDDQAETVLLRLLQGRGLYGMPAARALGAGALHRPLLDLGRADLERYARAHGLAWLEDPSNADPALDRNFVRHRVLPALRARFPAVDRALLDAMAARSAEDGLLLADGAPPLGQSSVAVDALLARDPAAQLAWLRLWLARHGRALPTGRALRALLLQLAAPDDRQPVLVLAQGALRRHRGRLWLVDPAPELADRYPLAVPGRLQLPHGLLALTPDPRGFACRGAVEVRFRGGGERIRSGGHHRSVKQLLQASGVPPWERPAYPLVFDEAGCAALPGIAQRDDGQAADMPRVRATWHPAAG